MATVPSIGRAVSQTAGIAIHPAEATRDLYERYGRQMFAYCLVQLRNREDAEDAVQTTFLNAFRGLERGVVPELESAWLYKIAQHVCLTRRRSWSRRRNVESPEDFDTVQEVIGSPMRDTDDLSELTDALRTLPEQQRRAILLREWQGLTYKEIAAEMQLSQAAVETLIFRARRGLAQAIERLRASGDMGSIVAAVKSLFFGVGTKVAVTVATVATTSVVAATPQARENFVHFVDAVSSVAAPATKPQHRHHATVVTPHTVAAAAPAATATATATAKHVRQAVGASPGERHAAPVAERMTKKSSIAAIAAAAPAATAIEPTIHQPKPSTTSAPVPAPTRTVVPPVVTQPTETTPTQTTTTPTKTSSGSGDTQPTQTTTTSTKTSSGTGDTQPTKTTTLVPPSLSSFSPSSGPTGTYVQVGGRNFTGATAVKFNGTSAPFSVSSDGQLTTKVPEGATSGPITIVTPNGSASSGDSFSVTAPAPTIAGTSSASGPVGTSVGIGGSHFSGATAVRFNSMGADFTVSSDGLILTHVPAGATSGPITVVTPNGTATSAGSFTVTVPPGPTVTGLSPASGPAGTYVQIGGTAFTGATAVKFNGVSASFTVSSEGQITAQVPSGATTGPVSVTTPNGTATSSGSFTVTGALPEISGFSPGSGAVGASVGIGGLRFTGATSVKFNGVTASFVVNSETSITAVIPSGATSGTITVTTPGGTATSSATFTVTH